MGPTAMINSLLIGTRWKFTKTRRVCEIANSCEEAKKNSVAVIYLFWREIPFLITLLDTLLNNPGYQSTVHNVSVELARIVVSCSQNIQYVSIRWQEERVLNLKLDLTFATQLCPTHWSFWPWPWCLNFDSVLLLKKS